MLLAGLAQLSLVLTMRPESELLTLLVVHCELHTAVESVAFKVHSTVEELCFSSDHRPQYIGRGLSNVYLAPPTGQEVIAQYLQTTYCNN